MNVINTVLGVPLGYIMYLCYKIAGSYGFAIILFTLVSKVLLFPISLSVQKNSVKMVKLKPELDDINLRYAGDKDKIAEEQIALYKREKYSPALAVVPTLIQIPLILGLINVIYNPLQHLLHLGKATIEEITAKAMELAGTGDLGFGAQLRAIQAVKAAPDAFGSLPDIGTALASIQELNLYFMGIDLSHMPSIARFDIIWVIPLMAALSTLIMSMAQNFLNVLQREQSATSQWGMAVFLTVFSVYFAFIVPAGAGLYWTVSNLLQILVMQVCNMVHNPRRYIDYQNRARKRKPSKGERAALKQYAKLNRIREKADSKRFYSIEDKQLVFVSPSSGYYKYYKGFIDYVTEHSRITVHYVTSDPADQVFGREHPQIQTYYIGERAMIPFMMKIDADMVIMTIPDLGVYHIKRSLVRKDVEYIFCNHAMTSMHLIYREGSLDYYDTVFCVHPQFKEEIRASEQIYGTKEKKLVEVGYNQIDNLVRDYAAVEKATGDKKVILIAPSWQKDNILELCVDEVLSQLDGRGYQIVVRPHPEFIKRFPDKMDAILKRYADKSESDLRFDTDFSSNSSILSADMLVTDWSATAIEFSYTTLKPSLFINTPMKIMNPNYKDIPIVPLDIALRDLLGVSVDVDKLNLLPDIVNEMFDDQANFQERILETRKKHLYHLGESGSAGGQYIIQTLTEKAEQKRMMPESEYI